MKFISDFFRSSEHLDRIYISCRYCRFCRAGISSDDPSCWSGEERLVDSFLTPRYSPEAVTLNVSDAVWSTDDLNLLLRVTVEDVFGGSLRADTFFVPMDCSSKWHCIDVFSSSGIAIGIKIKSLF